MTASGDTRVCVQVTENTTEPATIGRELKPLRAIRDAHSKAVMAMRGGYPTEVDSIKILGAADFLLHRRRDCVNGGWPGRQEGPRPIRSTSLLVALPSNRLLVLLVQTVPLVGTNGLRTHR